ncbi:MAG: hypothetical protein WBE86_03225 [Candidatus Acidiferrales bacterium]
MNEGRNGNVGCLESGGVKPAAATGAKKDDDSDGVEKRNSAALACGRRKMFGHWNSLLVDSTKISSDEQAEEGGLPLHWAGRQILLPTIVNLAWERHEERKGKIECNENVNAADSL